MEKLSLPVQGERPPRKSSSPSPSSFVNTHLSLTKVAVFLLAASLLGFNRLKPTVLSAFSSTPAFAELSGYCSHIPPIPAEEFLERQQRLVDTLVSLNASAYIAEPGPSAHYYANLSSWDLTERPLLLIISPDASLRPNLTILTPSFEESRVRLMTIPSRDPASYATWREEVNPYVVAVGAIPASATKGPVFVDGEMRTFVLDGLSKAAPLTPVLAAPVEVQRLRQRKSHRELEIMKCANEVTLLAVRAVRQKMYIGITQSKTSALLELALATAGLSSGDGLVLFGAIAARPHGGGGDAVLGANDLVLIDCGGTLHNYWSDLTRTFALPATILTERQLEIWYAVRDAQAAALEAAKNGSYTRAPDQAARVILKPNGWEKYFTHRLGHGIGLQMHESPYLRGGSDDIILTGHTFSDEPGVYIPGEIGVRLEDSFYIDESGSGVYLTERVGGQAVTPWQP
ncbi:Creatinase/aminopeptidase [Thelephora terrestris]|uniref:Creatinase/aminopeptidase n=1 Tax=Thelephora terrestris TaxID=56493 RepID=A0A9P6HLU5_9AGAM|nr:Creatinase/aminopeptidase [Thelephora terrestris]